MSRTSDEITNALPGEIDTIRINRDSVFHGEVATTVIVNLVNGKQVVGKFTTRPRGSFGGVVFSEQKDIGGLMIAKIKSVLAGRAE